MKNFLLKIFFLAIFFLYSEKIFGDFGEIFFSEIQWMGTTNSAYHEWIELKNNTNSEINLNGRRIEAEDGNPNFSFNGIIKGNGFFLLERTDDNSAYQTKGDFFYSGTLENGGEILYLKNGNGEIIDKIDMETWQFGNNETKESMERDKNGNWKNGRIDGNPKSSNLNSEIKNEEEINIQNNKENNLEIRDSQNGQNGQNQIQNVIFEFQSPSYILNSEENNSEYFCDNSKTECKINFNFEKTFEGFKKSDYFCEIKFGDLETGEEKKCNPNTVIFPIGETEISVKIFRKDGNFLEVEKKFLVKNIEKEAEIIGNSNENIIKNNETKKEDLSIKNGISENKFRIKSISLNETDGDFVEIFCLDCNKNTNIGGFKIYNSKNFFFFPIKKFGKYNLENQNSLKIFLKKDEKTCEEIDKSENDKIFKNDKTDKNIFCTNLKSGFTATNGSLFLMNQNGEILDAICWQNGKELKGKMLNEINILKNNNLWKGKCLNTEKLKKGDIFERENFSGYNESNSWKKFNINEIGKEKILETEKNFSGSEILSNSGNLLKIENKTYFEKNLEELGEDFFYNFLDEKFFSGSVLIYENLKSGEKNLIFEKINNGGKNLDEKILENNKKFLTKFFQEKTKFYKINLPKENSRIFKIRGRTIPFSRIFLDSNFEKISTISDEKGYFNIYFNFLEKGEKNFLVNFYFKGEKIFDKNLNFYLENNWISSEYKKENSKEIEKKLETENDKTDKIKNVIFELQKPNDTKNQDGNILFCEKFECRINFNFEKTFENFSKSDYFCEIKFGDLETGEEKKCNPNTVIFPIGETEISVKIFRKDGNFLEVEEKILIKNIEKELESENKIFEKMLKNKESKNLEISENTENKNVLKDFKNNFLEKFKNYLKINLHFF